jgi:alkylhydroperoxidase family enzyme
MSAEQVAFPWPGYKEVTDAPSDAELKTIYRDITGLRGTVLNLYKAMGHQPAALRAYMVLSRYIRNDAELPARLRELAIVRTGQVLDVPYELFHHVPAARQAGVSEAELAAVATWESASAFSPTERAVLAYAEQVARDRTVDEPTMRLLRANLSEGLIVDLALTVGLYHLCAAVIGPLRIGPENAGG